MGLENTRKREKKETKSGSELMRWSSPVEYIEKLGYSICWGDGNQELQNMTGVRKLYDQKRNHNSSSFGLLPSPPPLFFFPRSSSPVGCGSGAQDVCRYILADAGKLSMKKRSPHPCFDEGI